ncbi:hypothetical protein ACF3NR_02840 [Vaginella massiliensis]|uniref:hypothetical protein n=1 Tax=Vaginella massiliensis TaxID=1816680 RepID=UPI0008393267|nr:hypothetical protein [Vaginella massiliensis]
MRFKTPLYLTLLFSAMTFQSCREDFDYETITTGLSFNRDTVNVDTVFNHRKSETYVLKVYNADKDNKLIPKIYLNRGSDSYYELNVDGRAGKSFENIAIRGKDSLFVFVEIHAKDANTNPLYEDDLIFETATDSKRVKLLSWVEKADFLKDQTLATANWDQNTAKVIQGKVTVTNSLNISSGTKVYFEKDASLTIGENANFTVEGSVDHFVKFRSARHDSRYDSLPNQWNKIELRPNSISTINYAKIIGGDTGLEVNKAKLDLSNSYIVNHQSYGILARDAEINGHNLILNNANLAALAILDGGKYAFYHSTFANYFNMIGTAGPAYALYLSNSNEEDTSSNALVQAIFGNNIFYSDRSANAIALYHNAGSSFNYLFDTNLFKNTDQSTLDVTTATGFVGSIVGEPKFLDPKYTANNLRLDEESAAWGKGKISFAALFPTDIFGYTRTSNPHLGAIQ